MQYPFPLTETEKAAAVRKAALIDDYRQHMFDWMVQNEVAQLVAEFDGYGDSGQVGDVSCYTSDERIIIGLPDMKTVRLKAPWITDRWNEELREIVHIESASIALNEAIEEVVYYLLNQNWDGWEINEGSSGQVTFEARDRKVIVEISVRHIETKDHRKEF